MFEPPLLAHLFSICYKPSLSLKIGVLGANIVLDMMVINLDLLWSKFKHKMKSKFADSFNIGKQMNYCGGSNTIILQFVRWIVAKKIWWLHIDVYFEILCKNIKYFISKLGSWHSLIVADLECFLRTNGLGF